RCTTSSCASPDRRPTSCGRKRSMRRVLIIARSEFITAVRARGFLIGIMLMPILFGGAVLMQRLVERQANGIPRRVAVIDDTGELYQRLSEAAATWNRGERDF